MKRKRGVFGPRKSRKNRRSRKSGRPSFQQPVSRQEVDMQKAISEDVLMRDEAEVINP